MTLMDIVKKIFHAIFIGLLGFLTVLSIIAITLSLIATDREVIKSWPTDAGVYPKISDQLLSLVQQGDSHGDEKSLDQTLDDSRIDQAGLNSALKSVFTPSYWQSKFDPLVDSFYDWLSGQSPELKFKVAFNDRTDELVAALKTELTKQLSTYPTCSPSQVPKEFDPLSATCLPPGVSAKQAVSQFTNELAGPDSFLDEAVFTQDDLELDADAQQNAPRVYSALESLPWILGSTMLVLAILAVLTDKSILRGIRKVGQTLFGIGLVSWISFFIGHKLATGFQLRPENGDIDQDVFNNIVQPFVRAVFDDVTTTGLWVSLFVVITGTLAWLGAFIWHKVHHNKEAEDIAKRAMAGKSAPAKDPKLPPPLKPTDSSDKSKK